MRTAYDDLKFLKVKLPMSIFLEASKKLLARNVSFQAIVTQLAYDIATDRPDAWSIVNRHALTTLNAKIADTREHAKVRLTDDERDMLYQLLENDSEKP